MGLRPPWPYPVRFTGGSLHLMTLVRRLPFPIGAAVKIPDHINTSLSREPGMGHSPKCDEDEDGGLILRTEEACKTGSIWLDINLELSEFEITSHRRKIHAEQHDSARHFCVQIA